MADSGLPRTLKSSQGKVLFWAKKNAQVRGCVSIFKQIMNQLQLVMTNLGKAGY